MAQYAGQFAPKALSLLTDKLNHVYQFPKIDFVAIPDFIMGAMENWGLITFREMYLLHNDTNLGSPRVHQTGGLLISHELAHMWFGNEVTPEWWSYLWLSEGFARYFEYFITDQIEPTWRIMDQFSINNLQSALGQDDKKTVRPMTYDVVLPDEINALFDYIVYAKAGSVIRMFQNILGNEAFFNALHNYIYGRSHTTTRPQFLFESLQNEYDRLGSNLPLPAPMKNLFESWSNTPGYPVVNVNVKSASTVYLTQKRFYINPKDMASAERTAFYIPLESYAYTVETKQQSFSTQWFDPIMSSLHDIPFGNSYDFMILNTNQRGFYRVNYYQDNWDAIIKYLNTTTTERVINFSNRAQLIDDAANLARAGELGYETVFNLMLYLQTETDFIPWISASNALNFLNRMFSGSSDYMRLENYIKIVTKEMYEKLNLEVDQDHTNRINRMNVAYLACVAGLESCVSAAKAIVRVSIRHSLVLLMTVFIYLLHIFSFRILTYPRKFNQ